MIEGAQTNVITVQATFRTMSKVYTLSYWVISSLGIYFCLSFFCVLLLTYCKINILHCCKGRGIASGRGGSENWKREVA